MSLEVEIGPNRIVVPRPPVSVGRMANQLIVAFFDDSGYPTAVRPEHVPPVPEKVEAALTSEQQEKYKQDAAIAIDIAFFADRLTRPTQQEALRAIDYSYTEERSGLLVVRDKLTRVRPGQRAADHAIVRYFDVLSWLKDAHLADPGMDGIRDYRDLAQSAGRNPVTLKGSFDLGLETFRDTTRDLSMIYFRNQADFTQPAPEVMRNSIATIRGMAAMSLLKSLSVIGRNGNFRRFMIPGEKDGKECIVLDRAKMAKRMNIRKLVNIDPRAKNRTNNACPALAPISLPGAALVKALESMYLQQIDVLEDAGAWEQ